MECTLETTALHADAATADNRRRKASEDVLGNAVCYTVCTKDVLLFFLEGSILLG